MQQDCLLFDCLHLEILCRLCAYFVDELDRSGKDVEGCGSILIMGNTLPEAM